MLKVVPKGLNNIHISQVPHTKQRGTESLMNCIADCNKYFLPK